MLVSFESLKSNAFLKHSEKNDKRKENRQKSSNWKENRHFCTYPTPLFEARIEGYWGGHISARSPYFFFRFSTYFLTKTRRTVKICLRTDIFCGSQTKIIAYNWLGTGSTWENKHCNNHYEPLLCCFYSWLQHCQKC